MNILRGVIQDLRSRFISRPLGNRTVPYVATGLVFEMTLLESEGQRFSVGFRRFPDREAAELLVWKDQPAHGEGIMKVIEDHGVIVVHLTPEVRDDDPSLGLFAAILGSVHELHDRPLLAAS